MKRWKLLLSLTVIMCLFVCASSFGYAAGNYSDVGNSTSFIVQGKTVRASMVGNKNNCWSWANAMYNLIWNASFGSDFTSNNYLRNLSDADRALSVSHLQAYIGSAQLGASIRIGSCTSSCSQWGNDGLSCGHRGHNLIYATIKVKSYQLKA